MVMEILQNNEAMVLIVPYIIFLMMLSISISTIEVPKALLYHLL